MCAAMERADAEARVIGIGTSSLSFLAEVTCDPYLKQSSDGTLWVSPDLKPDEAARKFLEQLAGMYPHWLRVPVPDIHSNVES